MTIEYLCFIYFMGRLHLDPSALSSSPFMKSSFVIQMIIWIRGSWVLHIPHRMRDLLWMVRAWYSIAPIFFFSSYESSWKKLLPSGIHYFHEWIPWSWEAIQGGYHHFCILLLLPLQVVLHSRSSHSSTIFSKPSSDLSYLQIAWSSNKTSLVSLGKTLVVQVDPWLNQQWSC